MAAAPTIIMPAKRSIVLDATVLSSLMGCGRLVDFRFNHNLISINGKSNSLECGSIVHKYQEVKNKSIIMGLSKTQAHSHGMVAAELYARGCPFCKDFEPKCELTVGETKETHKHNINCESKPRCGHQPNEYEGVRNTPYEPEKQYQIGWKWVLETCEQYHAYYKNDHWVPLEAEIVKGKVIYQDDEIRILWKSKMDLVADTNQAILPVDYKTMKQRRDTMSLNNQFMGQCFTQGTHQVMIDKIGFQTTLKPEEKFIRDGSISYSSQRLLEWQGTIVPYWAYKLLDYQDNDYWPPNFDHCENKYGNCPFAEDVCTANPDDREREIKLHFIVGPDWNPTNEGEE